MRIVPRACQNECYIRMYCSNLFEGLEETIMILVRPSIGWVEEKIFSWKRMCRRKSIDVNTEMNYADLVCIQPSRFDDGIGGVLRNRDYSVAISQC